MFQKSRIGVIGLGVAVACAFALAIISPSAADAPATRPAAPTTRPSTAPSGQPGPDGQVFGDGGHAATIAFVCDNGGSMMFDIGSLRHELSKAIEGLNPSQKFSVTLLECGETEPYVDKDLIAATPENKKKAGEFLDDICEGGTTDPLVKLRLVFAQHPQLMYLLLTGDFGEMRGNQRVLDEIHKLDPNHKVRINTIAFTGSNDHDTDYLKLLKDLAAESGGKFRHVNVGDLK